MAEDLTMASLAGWGFPDVPAAARLLYAEGRVAVPAAGAAGVNLDGFAYQGGGVGFLIAHHKVTENVDDVIRLLGVSLGLHDFQRRLIYQALIPAGTDVSIQAAFGITAPVAYRYLRLSASGSLRIADATLTEYLYAPSINNAAEIHDGVLRHDDVLRNVTGAGINVYMVVTLAEAVRRYDVAARVLRVGFDVATDAIVQTNITDGNGSAMVPTPCWRGREAPMLPFSPRARGTDFLSPGQGYTVQVGQAATGKIPATATLAARLMLAVWNPRDLA